MKKLTFLFVNLIMVAVMVSCSKGQTDDSEITSLKKASVTILTASEPQSDLLHITPWIIPGTNNGGNRTCIDVAAWKGLPDNPFHCGDKIDYNNGAFAGAFPSGLDVTVTEGKYVSFKMDHCILIGDKSYKVGAVIVKGSNAANVYYYQGGTTGDEGLASPINASGNPAGLSNLTFCFIECQEQPQLVVAFKSYLNDGDWACTSGGPGNIPFVAYYNLVPNYVNKIYYHQNMSSPVGNIVVSDIDNDGKWEVTIDNSDRSDLLFIDAYLFVGTLEDYSKSYYSSFPYPTGVISPTSSLTFDLPF